MNSLDTMSNNRPSNVLLYVLISLIGLFGLFFVGLFLESQNWSIFNREASNSLSPYQVTQMKASNGS